MASGQYPNLTCVLFPGIVKNEEKALQCLGGIRNISEVYSQPLKKMGLHYRPQDPFYKKIYGDSWKTAGILVKVKIKKTKTGSEIKKEVVSTTIMGKVTRIYKFDSMCDFQYLPIQRSLDGSHQCFFEQFFPSGLDTLDFMKDPGQLYVVPMSFTRFEKPCSYAYTSSKKNLDKIEYRDNSKDLVVPRRSRSTPSVRWAFSLTNELPSEPNDYFLKQLNRKAKEQPKIMEVYEDIKKLFNERPIWSYNMIRYQAKQRLATLKLVMPCVAIYMHTGPWKKLWVRYGYDPRKIPEARIYQSLDVRVRHTAGMNAMVMKRNQVTQHKRADRERGNEKSGPNAVCPSEEIEEGAVYFRPGIIPTQRQMFYQYCDVQLPEMEEMLAVEPPPGYLCHQTRGWLAPNADHKCRDFISKYMKDAVFANAAGADLKLEGCSDDDSGSNSDEGEDTDPGASAAATGDEMT